MTIPFTTEPDTRIKIKILDTNNKKIILKAKKTTKIRSLKKACARRMDKSLDSFKLTYKGKVLKENETLQSLNMIGKNNIMIKVRPVQALENSLDAFVHQWSQFPITETAETWNMAFDDPFTSILDQNEHRLTNDFLSMFPLPNLENRLEQGVLVPNGPNAFLYQWMDPELMNDLANPITTDQTENRLTNDFLSMLPMPNLDIDEDMDDMPDDIRRNILLFEDFEDFIN